MEQKSLDRTVAAPGTIFQCRGDQDARFGVWLGEKIVVISGGPSGRVMPYIEDAITLSEPLFEVPGSWAYETIDDKPLEGDIREGDCVRDQQGLVLIARSMFGGVEGVVLDQGKLTSALFGGHVGARDGKLQLWQGGQKVAEFALPTGAL